MLRLAANLTMLFTETAFMDRFRAAQAAGFRYIEFLFPYEYRPVDIKSRLEDNGLKQVLFNLPAGDWGAGERGIAALPDRVSEFRAGVDQAIRWARELGVTRVNCLAGRRSERFSDVEQRRVLVENLRYAAEVLAEHGVRLMVEPLNHYDAPGFLLNRTNEVLELLDNVNHPNAYLQFDFYHAHREAEDLLTVLRKHLCRVGHIQLADSPGRHQPGTGEMDYRSLFNELGALGYDGYVAMEYVPSPDTTASLSWVREYGLGL